MFLAVAITMSKEAAAKVVKRFHKAEDELSGVRGSITALSQQMTAGAGEFSGAIDPGADAFRVSWRAFLDQCIDSAQIIAGNTNQLEVDLDRLDGDHATSG